MERDSRFDDIRPYYDEELPAAMERLAASRFFPSLAQFVFPNTPLEEVRHKLLGYKSVNEFQSEVMFQMNRQVVLRSITELVVDGMEWLNKTKRYLFIGNHRDIVLDSCLLMYLLFNHGHEPAEITFGSNLMQGQEVIDIGKCNKMFRVERGGNARDMYANSVHLSEYIRHAITEKQQSVWIAQRNGRTKDGCDKTDQGVIKMFGMSGPADRVAALEELNIVPVSVSYEWEPCDLLKALELYATKQGGTYVKKPGEDLNSILTGIMQNKGRVHFSICEPLRHDELAAASGLPGAQFQRAVAALIDKRIWRGYRLFENNYIAHDMLHGNTLYSDHYTEEQYNTFRDHLAGIEALNSNDDLLRIFLQIYSNPIEQPL